MGEKQMNIETVNLVNKYTLSMADKVEIKGENFDEEAKGKKIIIDDASSIQRIISNLKSVKKSPLCDCKPRFKLLFYKQKEIILILGFQNYEEHYYLRYNNEEQFIPNEDFFIFLNSIINYKGGGSSEYN